jgi:hypothetical protein
MSVLLESVLVAGLFAAILGWLALRIRRRGRLGVIALAAVVAASGAWTAASLRVVPLAEEDVPFRPIAVPGEGYVTSASCRSCHPREYATWHGSYHRTMTQVASPEAIVGDFDGVRLELRGDAFRLDHDDEVHWIDFKTPGAGGEIRHMRRPVLMTTGSHTVQAYWYPTGDRRNQALFPFVYLIPHRRWIPRESVFVRPPTPENAPPPPATAWPDDQRWNHTCIHCHTTHGQPRYAELDTRAAEFGIACESCHGPGEEHVRVNQDPLRRYRLYLGEEPDATVVEPRRLDRQRASEVCGICHGINYPRGPEILNDLDGGRAYRPGDAIEATRVIVQPTRGVDALEGYPDHDPRVREQSFWSDGMVRVKGREHNGLIESPCYQRGELSCFSCHAMHQAEDDPRPRPEWADDQLKPGMDGNLACLQCHDAYRGDAALAAHTRHAPESSGSECYNCHMSYTSYGLLKGIRSHQVDSPSVAASVATGRPNACNQCHLDKTYGWTAGYLEQWYEVPRPALGAVERAVPASLVWLLTGDAGQRALAAWSMGWEPARRASPGTHWMTPFLVQLLMDPYDAVRFNAEQALRLDPVFAELDYDFIAAADVRRAAAERAGARWRGLPPPAGQVADARDLLVDPDGELPPDVFRRLLARRNDRPFALAE